MISPSSSDKCFWESLCVCVCVQVCTGVCVVAVHSWAHSGLCNMQAAADFWVCRFTALAQAPVPEPLSPQHGVGGAEGGGEGGGAEEQGGGRRGGGGGEGRTFCCSGVECPPEDLCSPLQAALPSLPIDFVES